MAMNDQQIEQDILDVFQWDPRIEPEDISVKVEKGIVTLIGSVGTDEERVAAEEDIYHIVGVHQLRQRIEVREAMAARSWQGMMDFVSPTD